MRRFISAGLALALSCAAFLAVSRPVPAQAAVATVVSLTFDDDFANHAIARSLLDAHGMKGTFYVNSDTVGTSDHLTWGQLTGMAADGHEIAGHTLDHLDLTTLSATDVRWQVCEDRARLLKHGFAVSDLAYPYGAGYNNNTVRSIVQQCGYNSARRAWGVLGPSCPTCAYPYAESIPPGDLWGVRTADNPQVDTTLATIESFVTQAEAHGGGWVPLVFHNICDGCAQFSTSQAMLQAFLDWLQPRSANGTIVKTMTQVIGGAVKASPGTADTVAPTSSISCNGVACSTGWYNASVQVALSAADTGGSGLEAVRYTTDGTSPSLASPVYSGPFAVSASTTVKYRAYDNAGNTEPTNSQTIQIDTTPPTSSIACNGVSCSTGWYNSAVQVTLSATDLGSGVAGIRYTTDGADPAPSSPLYSGPFTLSASTTIKYRAYDNAGNAEATNAQTIQVDTTAPTSSIACNGVACSSDPYDVSVQVTLSATDTGSGVAAIRYTTDGSDPTLASPAYAAPFAVSVSTTIKYRAYDNAGNAEATNAQTIQVDTTAPTSSIACDGVSCSTGWYNASVQVTLSATDAHGSDLPTVRYTTDGSDPTPSSTLFTAAFTVSSTTTVKYRAYDIAGNGEATNAQTIQIDTTAPTSSITCNGGTCSTDPYGPSVLVTLSATDSGSGFAAVRYTTDGSDPTPSSPLYSGPLTVLSSTTVKYRAYDIAGNTEPTNSQTIQIDTTAPTSSIACNGVSCSTGWYNSAVQVTLSATDLGSGVAGVRYTTDGSDPAPSSPLYSGPFMVLSSTTVKYRAYDNVGNAEPANTQTIQIDTTAPTSFTKCNGVACSTGWYNASVQVTLSASDTGGSGLEAVRFTSDGSDPTLASPAYAGPFAVSVSTTIKYRAYDNAGNAEATNAQTVQIDTTAPTSFIKCNGVACSTGWYNASVQVTLAATDTSSGVAAIRYTTNGTAPTPSSTLYTGPLAVSVSTTVKYRAYDNAGNAEATNTQTVQIDTTAPTSSIKCNGVACSTGWYNASAQVTLAATDTGSGVAAIRYTTDGTTPTAGSTLYTGPITISVTTTVKYRAYDNAGNSEATKSAAVRIDTVAPAVNVTSPTSGGSVTGTVKIAASATDTGSGVGRVDFYVDTVLVGTSTRSPYSITWSSKKVSKGTHTLRATAVDVAGNRASASISVTVS